MKRAGFLSSIGNAFTGKDIREGLRGSSDASYLAGEFNKMSPTIRVQHPESEDKANTLSKNEILDYYKNKNKEYGDQLTKGINQTALAYGGTAAAGIGTYLLMKKLKERKQVNEAEKFSQEGEMKEASFLSNIGDAFTGKGIREGLKDKIRGAVIVNLENLKNSDLGLDLAELDEPELEQIDVGKQKKENPYIDAYNLESEGNNKLLKGIGQTALAYGGTAAAGLGTYMLMKKFKQRKQMSQDQNPEMPVEGETKEAGFVGKITNAFSGKDIKEGRKAIFQSKEDLNTIENVKGHSCNTPEGQKYKELVERAGKYSPSKLKEIAENSYNEGKKQLWKGVGSTALAYGGTAAAGLGTYMLMKKLKQRKQMSQDQNPEMPVEGEAKEAGLLSNIGDAFTGKGIREGYNAMSENKKDLDAVTTAMKGDINDEKFQKYKSVVEKHKEDAAHELKKIVENKYKDGQKQLWKGVGSTALAYGGTAAAGIGTSLLLKRMKDKKRVNENPKQYLS